MSLDDWRGGHGNGRGSPRVEMPFDEMKAVQDPEQAPARPERDALGRWVAGARHAQRRGGIAKRDLGAIATEPAVAALLEAPGWAEAAPRVRATIRAERQRVAERVGGGECSSFPSRCIRASVLLDEAAVRALARGEDALAGALWEKAAQIAAKGYVAAAHEAKHAPRGNPLAELRAELGDGGDR